MKQMSVRTATPKTHRYEVEYDGHKLSILIEETEKEYNYYLRADDHRIYDFMFGSKKGTVWDGKPIDSPEAFLELILSNIVDGHYGYDFYKMTLDDLEKGTWYEPTTREKVVEAIADYFHIEADTDGGSWRCGGTILGDDGEYRWETLATIVDILEDADLLDEDEEA